MDKEYLILLSNITTKAKVMWEIQEKLGVLKSNQTKSPVLERKMIVMMITVNVKVSLFEYCLSILCYQREKFYSAFIYVTIHSFFSLSKTNYEKRKQYCITLCLIFDLIIKKVLTLIFGEKIIKDHGVHKHISQQLHLLGCVVSSA
jgi:hypothetical protein